MIMKYKRLVFSSKTVIYVYLGKEKNKEHFLVLTTVII